MKILHNLVVLTSYKDLIHLMGISTLMNMQHHNEKSYGKNNNWASCRDFEGYYNKPYHDSWHVHIGQSRVQGHLLYSCIPISKYIWHEFPLYLMDKNDKYRCPLTMATK